MSKNNLRVERIANAYTRDGRIANPTKRRIATSVNRNLFVVFITDT